MRYRVVLHIALFLTLLVPIDLYADTPTSSSEVEQCMNYLGYNETDIRELLKGEIVSGWLPAGAENELAVSVAMLMPASLEEVFDLLRGSKMLEIDPRTVNFYDLGTKAVNKYAFAGVEFAAGEVEEVARLLRVEPGSVFNLSTSEISRLKSVAEHFKVREAEKSTILQQATVAEYRQILMDRYEAYLKGGLAAIESYDRGGGTHADPAKELALEAAICTLMQRFMPDFYRAFVDYPEYSLNDIEHQFLWVKKLVHDRPAFILAHRMHRFMPDYAVMTERQFYVGHTYNSLQIIVGSVPVKGGTLLFYQNRTFTDQVTGFASSIKHRIGRELMRDRIVTKFKEMRRSLEDKTAATAR